MGAIADLAVPEGGAVAALPVPQTDVPVTPEQLDVNTFTATAGPFRRGLRSGVNSLGATMNALIGQTGEVLGLTEFARDRFQDAKNYADFADRVGPPVRDFGAVRDAETLSKFVAGMAGQGVATSGPAIAAGLALRRPVAGVMAGSFGPEAGEEVMNLRADPEVMRTQSPGRILAKSVTKGAINAGIDASLGAEGQALSKVLKPTLKSAGEGFAKATGKAIAGEGVTEGVQNIVGQKLHQDLNPAKQMDWHDVMNDALAGAAGGGVIGAGGHAAGIVPGAIAGSADELRTRLGKKTPPPQDEPSLADINPDTSVDELATMLGDSEDKVNSYLDNVWGKVKDHPTAQKFKDYATDPDVRDAFKTEIMDKYNASEYKPKIDSAVSAGKKWIAGAQKWLDKKMNKDVKKSEMEINPRRDDISADINQKLTETVPSDMLTHMSESDLEQLGEVFRKMAENPDYFVETGVPHGLRKGMGTQFQEMMDYAVERVHAPGPKRTDAASKVKDVFKQDESDQLVKLDQVKNLIHENLKSTYWTKPKMRTAAMEELAPQLLNYVQEETKTQPKEFAAAMKEAFGTKADAVLEGLDRIRSLRSTSDRAYQSNLTADEIDYEAQQGMTFERRTESGPASDPRLNKVYKASELEEADRAMNDVISEYGRRNVRVIKDVDNKTHDITLHLEPADEVGLDKGAQLRVRENPKYNRSGAENGILTIETPRHPNGFKVNIIKLTNEMIRREGQQKDGESPAKYVADMFKRGIAALMATEEFEGFTKKGGFKDGLVPDNTKVATLHGRTYTFGEIKNVGKLDKWDVAGFTKAELKERKDRIAALRANRGWAPLNNAALQKMAVAELVAKVHAEGMAKVYGDRLEQRKEAVAFEDDSGHKSTMDKVTKTEDGEKITPLMRNKHEPDSLQVEPMPTLRSRDEPGQRTPNIDQPVPGAIKSNRTESHEMRKAIAYNEADIRPVPAPAKVEPSGTKPQEPHGKGPVSPEGKAAADETQRIQDALNSANPKVAKAAEEIRNPISKYSLMETQKTKLVRVLNEMPVVEWRKYISKVESSTNREALNDTEEFVRELEGDLTDLNSQGERRLESLSEAVDRAIKELDNATGSLFSAMNIKAGKQTAKMRQEVRAHIEKVLGKKKTEVLFEKLEHSGEFAKLDDVEVLKISLDSSDPMSVGYHESVHALMARLFKADPKAAHTLMRAASAAPIVARLRELLAKHPKALAQLEDPEERVAYMYQFWASGKPGLFSVGPNTRTFFDKVKGFFRKISAIWADDMSSAVAVERANDILDAFHNGAFADRNTVAEVLHDRFPEDPETKLRRVWPGIGKFMDKAIWTANGAVRDMNIPALTDIMDKFHTAVGAQGSKLGFNQVKRVKGQEFLNKVTDVVGGMNEEQRRILLEELQSGKPRTSAAAKQIEALNKELFKYMKDAGVMVFDPAVPGKYNELREIKDNYWHRVPNFDYLRTEEGAKAFIKMLKKNKVTAPENVLELWTRDIESGRPFEDAVLGLSFFTPQINERTLHDISNEDMAPFLNKDLFGTMSQYITRAVRRAEYTERFGNRGEAIATARGQAIKEGVTQEQLDVFDESVQAHEGTLGAHIDPKLKNLFGAVMTYQNVRLLPLQLFSSIVDPLGIMVRGGTLKDAGAALVRGFRELAGANKDDAYLLAATIGSISTALDVGLAGEMAGAQYMAKGQRWINEKFFKYNGMESWNRSTRIVATVAARDFITRHVKKPNEHSERFLKELNLDAKEVKAGMKRGKLDIEDPKIRAAMNQWVNEAVLTPNPAHRPIYMSDPHWMLVSHLKQYSYLFQKVVLARVYHELQHKNYNPAFALAGYVPGIIATDMIRVLLTPSSGDDTARKSWTMMDWLWRGIQRAGFFGPTQFALDTHTDAGQGRFIGQSIAGPTAEQILNFVRASAQGTGVGNELKKAIPGHQLLP